MLEPDPPIVRRVMPGDPGAGSRFRPLPGRRAQRHFLDAAVVMQPFQREAAHAGTFAYQYPPLHFRRQALQR